MMTYAIQFLVAVVATIGFAIIYNAPKKEVVLCGVSGAIGWTLYYIITVHGGSLLIGTLIGSLALTLFSKIMAIVRKMPATIYLLTGIFSLVPGAGIYYTAYYLFLGNQEMFEAKGLETFEVAAAIVIGIIFGSVIPQKFLNRIFGEK